MIIQNKMETTEFNKHEFGYNFKYIDIDLSKQRKLLFIISNYI